MVHNEESTSHEEEEEDEGEESTSHEDLEEEQDKEDPPPPLRRSKRLCKDIYKVKGRRFKKSEADHTLFTLQGLQSIVVVLIYLDDLIISGDNKEGIQSTKSFLKTVFDIKYLVELKYFLEIKV